VIVSPYYKLLQWKKLLRKIDNAKSRNVKFNFFGRAGEFKSINEVQRIGFEPQLIENLHAKIYFNEKEAIISSMNLHESSDNDSLDIALITESQKEYNDVISFYSSFILRHHSSNTKSLSEDEVEEDWID